MAFSYNLQVRISELQTKEKNYHIFYQMLAGLTQEERGKDISALQGKNSCIFIYGSRNCILYHLSYGQISPFEK